MMNLLPSVETASSVIQQEELQRQLLSNPRHDMEMSAMFSRGQTGGDKVVVCKECGGKVHLSDKCWYVVGFPKGHPNHGEFS